MYEIDPKTGRQKRGFGGMTEERRKAIAKKGGASVPGAKRSFAKDRDLAAAAGRKGGEAAGARRKIFPPGTFPARGL